MYILPECWCRYPIVFYFRKAKDIDNIIPQFNFYLRRLKESGLIAKWKSTELDRVSPRPVNGRGGRPQFQLGRSAMGLSDLRMAFALLVVGLAWASVAFIAEIVFTKVIT